jgi:hypothetical protein
MELPLICLHSQVHFVVSSEIVTYHKFSASIIFTYHIHYVLVTVVDVLYLYVGCSRLSINLYNMICFLRASEELLKGVPVGYLAVFPNWSKCSKSQFSLFVIYRMVQTVY